MGKYTNLDSDILSVFGTTEWKAEKITTFPANFKKMNPGNEFIQLSILPNGNGVNLKSVSGLLQIDIFTQAGVGPMRPSAIADKLDAYLSGKSFGTTSGAKVQLKSSSLRSHGLDKDNPALFRVTYSIPFTYSEVL